MVNRGASRSCLQAYLSGRLISRWLNLMKYRRNAPSNAFPMVFFAGLLLMFLTLFYVRSAPQESSGNSLDDTDRLIIQEIQHHSQLEQNLRYLTANMPARLTGSPRMDAAAAWAMQKFLDYGLKAHLETVDIPHAWTRGAERAKIISPVRRQLPIHAFGWSKSTVGPITGTVVAVRGKTAEDLRKYRGKVKGTILMTDKPQSLSSGTAANSFLAIQEEDEFKDLSPEQARQREQALQELIAEGPAVVLVDSGKSQNLFNMGTFTNFVPSPIPLAFILHKDYTFLFELAQTNDVSMTVDLEGSFSPTGARAPFVIAEIPGTSNPKERVVIDAHLDSWDLADGALDNGVGAMAVLEAARTLQAMHLKPNRTLVFLLSSGEEEHHFGIKAYLKNHAAELDDIDGVLVLDGGTGHVITINLGRLEKTEPVFQKIYDPMARLLGLEKPTKEAYFGSDHDEFFARGVPAYICVQASAHYSEAHHSQSDVLKYFDRRGANQAAEVLASWIWNASEIPEKIPRTTPK